MRRLVVLLVAVFGLAFLPSVRAPAAASGFLVGAARVDTTPPLFDAAADAAAFPSCPAGAFGGPRVFALQEPYRDTNGDGRFEYGEPFCDANHNARYDGIYISGGVDHIALHVHDPIDARAIAISDGTHTIAVVSVVAQGLFENYTARMRARARQLRPQLDDLIVSADHNESSPDTVGIYGAPNLDDVTGARSGIDEYYMDWLVDRVGQVAADAFDARQPATVAVTQVPVPASVRVRLSNNFPTTDDKDQPAAVDPKLGVLQARDAGGRPIVTMMSLAAHNQEIGHSGALAHDLSSDWPGFFAQRLESRTAGLGLFLVGDNGSIEDPETVPPVSTKAHPDCSDGCYAQSQATGDALADAVAGAAPSAQPIRPGSVGIRRSQFLVPLENNLFKAAAAAGLFGERQTYAADGVPAGTVGPYLRTGVAVADVGPDLQLLANPGEAFPALMVGSHWGIEDAGCPDRPNPPVPTWHASARWRLQVGLADDLIGYLIPPWGFSTQPGVYPTTCFNDGNDKDPKGHQHKLETESVGYTAAGLVADHLTALLDQHPAPGVEIRRGRFVRADGSLSRRPEGAVAIWLADPGATSLAPGRGTIVAVPSVGGFGDRPVDRTGTFVDYDGADQSVPDLQTHGMRAGDTRVFVDVYPALGGAALGPAERARPVGSAGGTAAGGRSRQLPTTGAGGWALAGLASLLGALGLRAASRMRGSPG